MASDLRRLVLIVNDEDTVVLVRDLLRAGGGTWSVDWAAGDEAGLDALRAGRHDVVLLSDRLGTRAGLDLLAEARAHGRTPPVVLLAEATDGHLDGDARAAQVDDVLPRAELSGDVLERALRYALERHRLGAALRESEARLRTVMHQLPARVWTTDRDLRVTWVHAKDLAEADMATRIGRSITDLVVDESQRPLVHEAHIRALAGEADTYRAVTAGVAWEARVEPHVDQAGRIDGVIGVAHDVTERSREEALRAARYRVTALLAQAPDLERIGDALVETICTGIGSDVGMLWLPDEAGEALVLGAAWHAHGVAGSALIAKSRALRFGRGAFLPGHVWASGEPEWVEDLERHAEFQRLEAARAEGLRSAIAFPIRRGREVHGVLSLYGRGVRAPNADVLAALGDIGDQIGQFRERTRVSAERDRLVSAVEQTAESIVIADRQHRIVYLNAATEREQGYPREALLGRLLRELGGELADEAADAAMWSIVEEGGSWSGVVEGRRSDGTVAQTQLTLSPLHDGEGAFVGAVSVGRDVTRERQLEQRLLQAQRMEAVGQLAGGIAHDFNNLLTAVTGYASLLASTLPVDDERREDVDQIKSAADRGAALVRQLLAFARLQRLDPVVLDPNAVIESLVPMLTRLIGEHIEVVTRLRPDVGRIEVDRSQLEQVIVNLAVNARDAMPDGGVLTIDTSDVVLAGDEIAAEQDFAPGPYVRITVSDTGLGMDAETRSHVFEPFYTTKGQGAGTGLGLSTVYGIVRQSRGVVWLYSEPGAGTVFRLLFPRVDAPIDEEPVVAVDQERLSGTETVLLAEDDDGVRLLVRRLLEQHGYLVLEAHRGDEALAVMRGRDAPVDLLLTDSIMPGMSGAELASRVAQEFGLTRVILMSGYTEEAQPQRPTGFAYLAKPFDATTLLRTVRAVLADDAGS